MSSPADLADLPVMGVRVAAGVTVAVPPRIDLLTPYVLLEQENWFEDEFAFLNGCLGAGAQVVDIGANYGLYSLSLARVAGPSGRVWSIEPASQTAAYLRKSVEINALDNITVIRKALSDKPGTARLSVETNSELNAITRGASGGATEEVQLDTLDSLAAEHGWSGVDFVKLDAEGEEERILEGGAGFLRSANPLVMFEVKHGERMNLQLVEKLAAAGYDAYILVPGLALLAPFDAAGAADPFRLNLFACKPERAKILEREGALARGPATAPGAEPLGHYRAAHDAKNAPALRLAHLNAAYAGMENAPRRDAHALASCARVARELGLRERAVGLMNEALKACLEGDPVSRNGPSLAAVEAFDTIDPQGRTREWLKAALLDGLVESSVYSTYFARGGPLQQTTLDRLEALKATGFIRAPMERRRQLLRVLLRLQAGPVPDAAVTTYKADNLNPELWGGEAPVG